MESKVKNIKTTDSLFVKLSNIVQKIGTVATQQNGGMAYATVSHNNVSKKVQEVFKTQNIVAIPDYSEYERNADITKVKCTYTVINLDDTNDRITVSAYGEGHDKQDKGAGKAQSYALKYCQMKLFSMATGKEDESDLYDSDVFAEAIQLCITNEDVDLWMRENWDLCKSVFTQPIQIYLQACVEKQRKKIGDK